MIVDPLYVLDLIESEEDEFSAWLESASSEEVDALKKILHKLETYFAPPCNSEPSE